MARRATDDRYHITRHRADLARVQERHRDMIAKGQLSNVATEDTTSTLLNAILDAVQTEETKFEVFRNRWPHLVMIRPTDDERLREIAVWCLSRLAFKSTAWSNHDNVLGFEDADLAFEFKMRWGGRS